MRMVTALALGALAIPLLARTAAATPADRYGRFLDANISWFATVARDGANRTAPAAHVASRTDGNDESPSIGAHDKRDRYAIGMVFGLGVAAYFLGSSQHSDQVLVDPPANGPGDITKPQNDGSVNNDGSSNLPPQVGPDTTVTPEPGTMMLLGTGLSSLTLVARRRRIPR